MEQKKNYETENQKDEHKDENTVAGIYIDLGTKRSKASGIGKIKEAMEAANASVEESAKGVVNVTEMSVRLTERISDIGNEAHVNMNVADDLNEEVNKFKLE